MKFTIVVLFIAFYAAYGVEAKSVQKPEGKLTGHSSPINSGDIIALRSAFTRGSYSTKWLKCSLASCAWTNCPKSDSDPTGWPSCSEQVMFTINRPSEGGVINSGDKVLLSPIKFGPGYLVACDNSTSAKCSVKSTSGKLRGGGDSLHNSKAFFQIYSRDAEDGSPVENRDVVGFKYPYSSNRAWLTFQPTDNHFYPLPCSRNSKMPCAAKDKFTGFVIYKKLPR